MEYQLRALRHVRSRDLNECIADAVDIFTRLGKVNPSMFRWKELGKTKRAGIKNHFIDFSSYEEVSRLISKGVNRRDVGQDAISELGYTVSLWNGADKEENSVDISYSNGVYSQYVSNIFFLRFPTFGYLDTNDELALRLIEIAVDAVDADWASLYSAISSQRTSATRPILDRGVYISNDFKVDFDGSDAAQCFPYANGKIYLK